MAAIVSEHGVTCDQLLEWLEEQIIAGRSPILHRGGGGIVLSLLRAPTSGLRDVYHGETLAIVLIAARRGKRQ